MKTGRWTIAILLSAVLHAGAAIWLGPNRDEVQIAGSSPMEIALAGNAFQDAVAAGEASPDVTEPVDTADTATPPVEGKTTEARETVEAADTVNENRVALAVETVPVNTAEVARERPVDVETAAIAVNTTSQPERAAEPVNKAPAYPARPSEPVEMAMAAPPATKGTVALPADAPVAEPTEAARSAAETPQQPVETEQTLAAIVNVPLPTPRPDHEPKAAEEPRRKEVRPSREKAAKPVEKTQRKAERPDRQEKKPARQRAGAGGRSDANARRGAADGSERGRTARSGKKAGSSREAGNAAVSNYPGQVVSRLRRNLRYPSQARRQRIRGEVHVRFTVSRSGSVAGVSIVRSSGSAVLDKAALDTVRRAAPFPAIPAGAGRSNWPFTVPLAFTR